MIIFFLRFVDKSVHMFDQCNLTSGGVGAPVHKLDGHKVAVLYVQWFLDKASIFRRAAEDGFLNIWDYEVYKSQVLQS
ncbi:WD-40 repeat-containing protein MSI4-like [Zingiber officinale]|uniref:WD-40 repeat-containing protein MSI4-like n=1 Tax=Zingiber officinale TaxID=94328 RepID=UPI001C4C3FFE|nr:WD-40 repeat-containing protein MSI4-like [Zingiber officinale]